MEETKKTAAEKTPVIEEYETKDTIAKLFGVSGRRIEQLVEDGIISRVRLKSGAVRFESVATIQKYIQYLSDKAKGKERSETETKLKEQKLRAEVALKESQGELHRLRTEIAAGKYISLEEVKADYSRFFIVFKNFALAMPGKIAGRLTGVIDATELREIEGDLNREVRKLLINFVSRAVVQSEKKENVMPEKKDEEVMQPKRRGRPRKNAGT